MAVVFVSTGKLLSFKYLLNNATPANVVIHLYTNNWSPSFSDVLSNYTETTATGYAPITMSGANWTFATNGDNSITATYPQVTFNFSSSDNIYGAFYTLTDNTTLMYAERFLTVPVFIPSGGGQLFATPTITIV